MEEKKKGHFHSDSYNLFDRFCFYCLFGHFPVSVSLYKHVWPKVKIKRSGSADDFHTSTQSCRTMFLRTKHSLHLSWVPGSWRVHGGGAGKWPNGKHLLPSRSVHCECSGQHSKTYNYVHMPILQSHLKHNIQIQIFKFLKGFCRLRI